MSTIVSLRKRVPLSKKQVERAEAEALIGQLLRRRRMKGSYTGAHRVSIYFETEAEAELFRKLLLKVRHR